MSGDLDNSPFKNDLWNALLKTFRSPTAIAAIIAAFSAVGHANGWIFPLTDQQLSSIILGLGEYGGFVFVFVRRWLLKWRERK